MSAILDKHIVLSLTASWQPHHQLTVRDAITAMTGGSRASPPALALDLEVVEGQTVSARPVAWDEWITLPVRSGDLAITTSRQAIRVPTVIICPNYNKMPMRKHALCFNNVFERDGGRCMYTGKVLARHEANLDHVIPASQGGPKSWENLVTTSKRLNTLKADKRPEEVGLKLIRKPVAPLPVPASVAISRRPPQHPDHVPFLLKVK